MKPEPSSLKLIYDDFAGEFKFIRDDGIQMTLADTIWWLSDQHDMSRTQLARYAALDHLSVINVTRSTSHIKRSRAIGPVLRVLFSLGYGIIIKPV